MGRFNYDNKLERLLEGPKITTRPDALIYGDNPTDVAISITGVEIESLILHAD